MPTTNAGNSPPKRMLIGRHKKELLPLSPSSGMIDSIKPMEILKKIPIIDVTDLYHPYQDPGDNVDILAPYSMEEIDLRAVILDATERFRHSFADHENPQYRDEYGPREPGIIPLTQLNYLYGQRVPFEHGPFTPMKSPEDKCLDAPAGEQFGIELILKTLRESEERVTFMIFSSCRAVAAAYNREPELFHERVKMIHLSAGSSGGYLEWNVMLDPHAFVCLMRSPLPISLYPCAGSSGPFDLDTNNTFWRLPSLGFIQHMQKPLRNYLEFVFERSARKDFLACLKNEYPGQILKELEGHGHNVWETQIWLLATGKRLVIDRMGRAAVISSHDITPDMKDLTGELRPVDFHIDDHGLICWGYAPEPTNKWLYYRENPTMQEAALRDVFPDWYLSFCCPEI